MLRLTWLARTLRRLFCTATSSLSELCKAHCSKSMLLKAISMVYLAFAVAGVLALMAYSLSWSSQVFTSWRSFVCVAILTGSAVLVVAPVYRRYEIRGHNTCFVKSMGFKGSL